MLSFNAELRLRLDSIRQQGLFRELRGVDSAQGPRLQLGGRELINFSSNDYLGLANHPALKEAAIQSVERYGAGSGGSRLLCGSLAPHQELEAALAAFKGTEAALTFSTGYATALGTITALLGKDDVVILDKLVHACIVDAARLSGAQLRVFKHNDLNDLADLLQWADSKSRIKHPASRTLVVTESVFSMDGDHAPLKEIVTLKEKYGAWLMVDEAHATGLYGIQRRGRAEELGVSERIEIQMGTLGKAIGASGGYVCGSRVLVDFLVNRARSFIFSTAPVPAASGAAKAGIRLVQSSEGDQRKRQAMRLASLLQQAATVSGMSPAAPDSLIVPIVVGEESNAVSAATEMRERGLFVPAIRYPTVARGSARLRLTITATHSEADMAKLLGALKALDLGTSPLDS